MEGAPLQQALRCRLRHLFSLLPLALLGARPLDRSPICSQIDMSSKEQSRKATSSLFVPRESLTTGRSDRMRQNAGACLAAEKQLASDPNPGLLCRFAGRRGRCMIALGNHLRTDDACQCTRGCVSTDLAVDQPSKVDSVAGEVGVIGPSTQDDGPLLQRLGV